MGFPCVSPSSVPSASQALLPGSRREVTGAGGTSLPLHLQIPGVRLCSFQPSHQTFVWTPFCPPDMLGVCGAGSRTGPMLPASLWSGCLGEDILCVLGILPVAVPPAAQGQLRPWCPRKSPPTPIITAPGSGIVQVLFSPSTQLQGPKGVSLVWAQQRQWPGGRRDWPAWSPNLSPTLARCFLVQSPKILGGSGLLPNPLASP